MDGKVNGAVETCFSSFHPYAQYMNFSHPLIKAKFNPRACACAYGVNFFYLDAWREKCPGKYHCRQTLNENRTLWKLGTSPPGLITYYSTTKPLEKSWHVPGARVEPEHQHGQDQESCGGPLQREHEAVDRYSHDQVQTTVDQVRRLRTGVRTAM